MKRYIIICLLLLNVSSYGQGSGMQAMIKQIALVQVYTGYLQKGYSIAKQGLHTISTIKDGHWKLDIAFFDGLKRVNPAIADYSRVAEILRLQQNVLKRCRTLKKLPVHADEAGYINRVIEQLITDMESIFHLLNTVLSNEKLTMDDAARIKAIEKIYDDLSDKFSFITTFLNDTKLLLSNRAKDANDTRTLSILTSVTP